MAKITGVGGVFFKSKGDSAALSSNGRPIRPRIKALQANLPS